MASRSYEWERQVTQIDSEEPTSDERAFVVKFEVIFGGLLLIIFLFVSGIGIWLLEREQDARIEAVVAVREESVRLSTIRSVQNCNELENVKLSMRAFISSLTSERLLREAALQHFAAIPGGTFVNERGETQWRGCGEYPDPVDPPITSGP